MNISTGIGSKMELQRWVSRLKVAARTGRLLDLGHHQGERPSERSRTDERYIPTIAIRQVLASRSTNVDPHGLQIRGALFLEELDLAGVEFPHPLRLLNCDAQARISLRGAEIKELCLSGTHARGVELDQAKIASDCLADNGFEVTGTFSARGVQIGGRLVMSHAILRNETEAARERIALNLDSAEVKGELLLNDGFEAHGEVLILAAHIGGQLNLNNAAIYNAGADTLSFDSAEITGGILARRGFKSDGKVRGPEARVGGLFDLSAATLRNTGDDALHIDRISIAGGLVLADGFAAEGCVHAVDARIGGSLNLSTATLLNPDGDAINVDGAEIARNLYLRNGFEAAGTVRANGAKIGGDLELRGATLRNCGREALKLDGIAIAGDLMAGAAGARGVFRACGTVCILGATIGGEVNLTRSIVRRKNDDVDDPRREVHGPGACFDRHFGCARSTAWSCSAKRSHVELANIKADDSASDSNNSDHPHVHVGAVCIKSASMRGLVLRSPIHIEGLDLRRAVIGDLETGEELPAPLTATGWRVADIQGPVRGSTGAARRWLKSHPNKKKPAQPWWALAEVYERNGDPAAGRRLRFFAANKVTRQSPTPTKVPRLMYGALVGHGYYPIAALAWLIIVLAVSSLTVFNIEDRIVPANYERARAAVLRGICGENSSITGEPGRLGCAATVSASMGNFSVTANSPCEAYPGYPCWHWLSFTLNSVVPAWGTPNADWIIRTDGPLWLTGWLFLLKFFAWSLLALLLAGVTGLLRRT
ncbi:hypothetical protein [Mycolicibacterium sp. XJ879]